MLFVILAADLVCKIMFKTSADNEAISLRLSAKGCYSQHITFFLSRPPLQVNWSVVKEGLTSMYQIARSRRTEFSNIFLRYLFLTTNLGAQSWTFWQSVNNCFFHSQASGFCKKSKELLYSKRKRKNRNVKKKNKKKLFF